MSTLAVGDVVGRATRFAAAVLLARALTLDEFGLVNTAIAISGVLVSSAALGLPDFGAREVAVNPGGIRGVAGLVLVLRTTALAVLSAVAVVAIVLFAPAQAYVVVLAALMAAGTSASLDWLLRGREQMDDLAAATAFGGVVVLAGCGTIMLLFPSVTVAVGVFTCGEAAAALVTWWRARIGRPKVPSMAQARIALRAAWPLGASGLIIYMSYANLDTILLAAVRSPEQAGLYSAPYRVFLAANAVAIYAAYALLPMLSRAHEEGRTQEGRHLLRRAFLPLAGYGTLVLAAAELVGGSMLSALFGPDFAGTGSVLTILCIALPWNAIGFPAGYSLIGERRNRDFLRGAAVAGVLNLLLMALLIPTYGIDGAALATTAGLLGGALVWIALAAVVRPVAVLGGVLALVSIGGLVSVRSPGVSVVVGLTTGAIGLAMVGTPILIEHLRQSCR